MYAFWPRARVSYIYICQKWAPRSHENVFKMNHSRSTPEEGQQHDPRTKMIGDHWTRSIIIFTIFKLWRLPWRPLSRKKMCKVWVEITTHGSLVYVCDYLLGQHCLWNVLISKSRLVLTFPQKFKNEIHLD